METHLRDARWSGQGRRSRAPWWLPALLALALLVTACGSDDSAAGAPSDPAATAIGGGPATVSYKEDVWPIFLRNCVGCHGGTAGLWLNSYKNTMAGSSNGPVVVPGKPDESELYLRITGQRQPAMPLNGRLAQDQIDAIRTWISEGALNN